MKPWLVPLLAIAVASAAWAESAEEHILQLTVQRERGEVAILVKDPALGWLVPAEALPRERLKPEALANLPTTAYRGQDYVPVSALGEIRIDAASASANLQLRPALLQTRDISLSPPLLARPEQLHQGPSLLTNVFVSLREQESQRSNGYLAVIDSRLSAGVLGTLHGGYRFSAVPGGEDRQERLPVFLETHFPDQLLTLRSGEVRAQSEINDVSYGIAGFQLQSNFLTRPDLFQRPTLDFFTALESPSVVELFVDGQRRFRREFEEPGEVMLSDFRPSGDGRVLLLVTDAAGTQRIVEADFYNESGLLPPGMNAYALAGGFFRDADGDISRSGLVTGNWQRGFSERFTAGVFAEMAGFDGRDALANGRRYAGSTGLSLALSTPLGGFSGTTRWRSDSLSQEGYSSRLNWRYRWRQPWALVTAGATVIDEKDYRTLLDAERDLSGYRVFVAAGLPYVTLNVAQFDLSGQSGWQSVISSRLGQADVSLSWQKAGGFDHVVGASLSLPLGPTQIRSSVFRANDSGATQYRLEARSELPDQNASVYVKSVLDGDNSRAGRRLAVGGTVRSRYGLGAYELREIAGERQQVMDVSTALAIGPDLKTGLLPPQSKNSGVAVIDVGLPGIRVRGSGGSAVSDWRGLAMVPVTGFGKRQVMVDLQSLPARYFLHVPNADVSVMPGQSAYAVLRPRLLDMTLRLPQAREGDIVLVNGHAHPVVNGQVTTDRLRAGPNEVRLGERSWTLRFTEHAPATHITLEAE